MAYILFIIAIGLLIAILYPFLYGLIEETQRLAEENQRMFNREEYYKGRSKFYIYITSIDGTRFLYRETDKYRVGQGTFTCLHNHQHPEWVKVELWDFKQCLKQRYF